MVDDVWHAQKGLLGVAAFVGVTTWLSIASLYYLVERRNPDMIYCGHSPACSDMDVDTSLCIFDEWGLVDCTAAGCSDGCYNLYQSIPSAAYYTLLNLFGEFPLIDQHSTGGMVVGTFTAVIAVAVFALPAGIIGNGFETEIDQRRSMNTTIQADSQPIRERSAITPGYVCHNDTLAGNLYNFLHAQVTAGSKAFDHFINVLIGVTVVCFLMNTMEDTVSDTTLTVSNTMQQMIILVFTIEYLARVYSSQQDPKYQSNSNGSVTVWGVLTYMSTFFAVVDLCAVGPSWISLLLFGVSTTPLWVQALLLLRILRFEKYTHAFRSFDDVLHRHLDVLAVTAFTAILLWVFFGALLYLTERDNLDPEMRSNYNTVPNSMWVTLLNLSGESPLAQYSVSGKIATGMLGLVATGIFGIPIGLLGAGFEEVLAAENQDNTDELDAAAATPSQTSLLGTPLEQACFQFVNGMGSVAARLFETSIYVLIFVAVAIGVWQTVEGHESDLQQIEALAVAVFTVEYVLRLVGVGADPEFASTNHSSGITSRLRFMFSFYSLIDLFAIVPYYIVLALPDSLVNDYDEYLRMLRILRLVKLDKYVPSITLIDDVVRLKLQPLKVAGYAAMSLWLIFAALIYLFEFEDTTNELDDPVPAYGCTEDCTMQDRFRSLLDSMIYTGISLTGDYPIITYTWPARFVNVFMVLAAVGVVSIPSALIASGFVEIVDSKQKARKAREEVGASDNSPIVEGIAGDDWYEHAYRALEGVEPPPSRFGPSVDRWQYQVDEFLNGKEGPDGHTQWTPFSRFSRGFIFTVIISNVAAVLLESVPTIDRAVGNEPGNFFDRFEALSVMVFATEYILRLFCAPKNRQALYSTFVYATTFFGIVDFLSTAPWFLQQALIATGHLDATGDQAKIFRIFRIFRILQLEDFMTAFSKLDNVFRASKDVLKATGLMAIIIWVGCAALFFIFEENNPNWRSCDESVPLVAVSGKHHDQPGCFDFASTAECNLYYPDLCEQKVFTNMPNALYLTAVFLGGEWGVVDFTWPGRLVCMFLCVVGIGLYAIPIGSLFDSFGAVLFPEDDEEEEED